jgi:hypothetical protein
MKTVRINENNIFTILTTGSIVLIILFSLGGLALHSLKFAWSVICGGVLAYANFYWLRNILQRTLLYSKDAAASFTLFRYILRLALLGIVISLLIIYAGINVFGLLLGLSVLVVNIIIISIYLFILKGG